MTSILEMVAVIIRLSINSLVRSMPFHAAGAMTRDSGARVFWNHVTPGVGLLDKRIKGTGE